ncbi:MAG: DUF2721 domain-containing protein [Thermoguttaceae bacterium]|jgi:hypothetical protein
MLPHLETIQSFVAPVVMISANGLLCLAFYNRLSALANRSRVMNKERFDLVAQLSALQAKGAVGLEPEHLELRIATLDEIGHQLFDRASWIRRTLMSLLISVLCMLGCSLCLGLTMLVEAIAAIAPWLFVVGIISMMVGILAAIEELRRSLKPLLFEHEQIDDLP